MKTFPAQEVKSLDNSDCQQTDIKSASEICTSTPIKSNSEEKKTQVLKKLKRKHLRRRKSRQNQTVKRLNQTIPCLHFEKDDQEDQVSAKPSNEQVATCVITVSSSSDTSDDDIPVARLSKKTSQVKPKPKPLPNKCVKRRLSDSSLDQASQRVVLRLTKQSRGASDGYKVSDISHEKHDSKMSCSSSDSEDEFPGMFTKPTDGTLPIIKDTLFLKENEPKLLVEFLNNLNMYGTSKGVTMLVESNQSYFAKGPELTKDHSREALDNLVFNDEFPNERNKSITKRKIKTWQKIYTKKINQNTAAMYLEWIFAAKTIKCI
ncbi:uncharacterized protein CEXT_511311 [Caerostris extrusa]|uniref:Uncharacterized protein n=1 Tax=Caerostris extrusa TaxID=172846 RepID=A0AAV4W915_CAEEX|nr:uncharacterized protein CEXT_511311 [Caerostris extrusa]